MISSAHRFHGHASLKFVYKNGTALRAPHYMIKHVANPRRKNYRAAVVVSKKVHKSAVVRNRIRRRIYEIIRRSAINKNVDIVCLVFDERLASLPSLELQRSIKGLLKKAGII